MCWNFLDFFAAFVGPTKTNVNESETHSPTSRTGGIPTRIHTQCCRVLSVELVHDGIPQSHAQVLKGCLQTMGPINVLSSHGSSVADVPGGTASKLDASLQAVMSTASCIAYSRPVAMCIVTKSLTELSCVGISLTCLLSLLVLRRRT